MAFALWRKQIKCPNCQYEGKAQIKGSGCGLWLVFLVLFSISFLFWPLFIVAGIMFLWLLLKPADQICPKCKYVNPIPK
ncbi:LITAF-like zinc ribbon domain-containing protein [Desulfosarcina sp. BuS5]|uniref:LITAF-like zinc ribbon domain-containing protein n=1 Tax=Desulfosarcina sp. BuS5 TaxID=933262 RepID=UPI00048889FA